MIEPICFGCRHFRQYQPLTFMTPGECKWEPGEAVPEWLQFWLGMDDRYYGPTREVRTTEPMRHECEAFQRANG